MRIYLIIVLILFEFNLLSAQEIAEKNFKIGITGGYGQYIQSDLKKLNQDIQSHLSFNTILVDNFPVNTFWGAYFLIRLTPGLYIGPSYQFHTTGSRLGIKDYSGSYTFDQIISCHSIGFQTEKSVIHTGKLDFSVSVMGGVNISEWVVKEDLIIGSQDINTTKRFSALRTFIYPAVNLGYQLIGPLTVSISGGYSIDLSGEYKSETPNVGKPDKVAKWTGLRASLSFDYSF